MGTLAYSTLQAENAVFGASPTGSSASPGPTALEREAAAKAQSVRVGWNQASSVRAEAFKEVLRLGQGAAQDDTDSFAAAYDLLRGLLQSDFLAASSYVSEMRRARPYVYNASLKDDWERFRAPANSLAQEWDTWCLEVKSGIRLEGAHYLPTILDLAYGPG